MFLDASAIVAILVDEPDAGYLLAKIEQSRKPVYYSSLVMFEAVINIARIRWTSHKRGSLPMPPEFIDDARQTVQAFIEIIGAKELTISGTLHRKAIEAARTYGRFVAHPARLNFGDCFSYASAREYRLPLLFKGEDFSQTDIEVA